jgi:hypothetical protein
MPVRPFSFPEGEQDRSQNVALEQKSPEVLIIADFR